MRSARRQTQSLDRLHAISNRELSMNEEIVTGLSSGAAEPRIPFSGHGSTGPADPIRDGYVKGDADDAPEAPCATCGGASAPTSYVYALGRIEARFPSLSVEKEFAQVAGRSATVGTHQQVVQAVLARPDNRYLARQMCWVLTVQGIETYLLKAGDPFDLGQLISSIRTAPSPNDIDVVVGVRGPLAPPDFCNGLVVPIVRFDQLYSFDRDTFLKSVPAPKDVPPDRFGPAVLEVFDRVMQLTDNAGASDDHRALNFLVMRYSAIYAKVAEAFAQNFALSAVDVQPWGMSGTRRVVEVIFSFNNRATDFTEKYMVRVDVTEQFPFLVTKLSPYYDR
jgi:hypothetical protein